MGQRKTGITELRVEMGRMEIEGNGKGKLGRKELKREMEKLSGNGSERDGREWTWNNVTASRSCTGIGLKSPALYSKTTHLFPPFLSLLKWQNVQRELAEDGEE